MTTVACNRDYIAADSLIVGDHMGHGRKVFKVKGNCIGIAGTYVASMNFVRWYKRKDKDSPPDGIEDVNALVLTPSGSIRVYEGTVDYYEVEDDFCAIGSGAGAALAAMHLGCNPVKAIETATKVDAYTGGKIHIRRRG